MLAIRIVPAQNARLCLGRLAIPRQKWRMMQRLLMHRSGGRN